MGHDAAVDAICTKRAHLVLFTVDASPRVQAEIRRLVMREMPQVRCIQIKQTMDTVHMMLGYRAGIMSVNDENFAKRLIELLNQEGNAYGSEN